MRGELGGVVGAVGSPVNCLVVGILAWFLDGAFPANVVGFESASVANELDTGFVVSSSEAWYRVDVRFVPCSNKHPLWGLDAEHLLAEGCSALGGIDGEGEAALGLDWFCLEFLVVEVGKRSDGDCDSEYECAFDHVFSVPIFG